MALVDQIQQRFTAGLVYGDPIEKDGAVLLPAVRVIGGGGGGSGERKDPESVGEGGGFGLMARPAGSWVITGSGARWVPAIDAVPIVFAVTVLVMSYLRYRLRVSR
jgi:uncharacterized spore protein YtfJ